MAIEIDLMRLMVAVVKKDGFVSCPKFLCGRYELVNPDKILNNHLYKSRQIKK